MTMPLLDAPGFIVRALENEAGVYALNNDILGEIGLAILLNLARPDFLPVAKHIRMVSGPHDYYTLFKDQEEREGLTEMVFLSLSKTSSLALSFKVIGKILLNTSYQAGFPGLVDTLHPGCNLQLAVNVCDMSFGCA